MRIVCNLQDYKKSNFKGHKAKLLMKKYLIFLINIKLKNIKIMQEKR